MRVLVTGSSGLLGSEVAVYFHGLGADVAGIDNDMRACFFGPAGDTRATQRRLQADLPRFRHRELDVRDRGAMLRVMQDEQPDLIVHCAAQPSDALAATRPFEDFDVNARGTHHLLEAFRRHAPQAVFCHVSTNRVYGDAPNALPLVELERRWDYADPKDRHGVAENCRIDSGSHAPGGASRAAADVMAQDYGRFFGLHVGVFRTGCITGPGDCGGEPHGFLRALVQAAATRGTWAIRGHKGKQVRDYVHALDVARAVHRFYDAPRHGEVYNLGGGRANSCSILEAIAIVEDVVGQRLTLEYDPEPRPAEHVCYISDQRKFETHFPGWTVEIPLQDIVRQLIASWEARRPCALPWAV